MARRLGEKVTRDAAWLLQILALVDPDDVAMSPRELRQVSDLTVGRFGGALSQLQSEGLAVKEGRRWRVTPEGRQWHYATD
jgi:predicted transcriptional regulator